MSYNFSYVAIKQVREAAKILARRTDQQSLRAAAHMNFIASENQEGLIYAQKVVHHHLVSKNWAKIHEFCEESKQLKVRPTMNCCHGNGMFSFLPQDPLCVRPTKTTMVNSQFFHQHNTSTLSFCRGENVWSKIKGGHVDKDWKSPF